MQRVVIVDPTETTRESLRTLLLGVDFVWLESECTRYEYFLNVIAESTPDLAIVALDADKQKALQMIGQLSASKPGLPILTISQDHQALLQSLQKGAKYFLTQPVGLEDMLAALRRALGEGGQDTMGGAGTGAQMSGGLGRATGASQVIAVLGSRGGVGTTTLAVNLAATLASSPDNNAVALIDLDLALGDADIALELKGIDNISIADLARSIDRLDMNFLRRALVKHEPTGLAMLRHPLEIHEMSEIHETHVQKVLSLLRISYSHLVVDLTKTFRPTDLAALHLADKVLLVGQLELSSLRNVVRMLHTLAAEDGLADKCHVVLNKVGSEAVEEGISVKKAEEVVGRPIYWQVPNDHKALIAARVAGGPLCQISPKSRAQVAIAGLADHLCGKKAQAHDAKHTRGWFGRK